MDFFLYINILTYIVLFFLSKYFYLNFFWGGSTRQYPYGAEIIFCV